MRSLFLSESEQRAEPIALVALQEGAHSLFAEVQRAEPGRVPAVDGRVRQQQHGAALLVQSENALQVDDHQEAAGRAVRPVRIAEQQIERLPLQTHFAHSALDHHKVHVVREAQELRFCALRLCRVEGAALAAAERILAEHSKQRLAVEELQRACSAFVLSDQRYHLQESDFVLCLNVFRFQLLLEFSCQKRRDRLHFCQIFVLHRAVFLFLFFHIFEF